MKKKIDPDLLGSALAYSALHGDVATSQHFKISTRTLQRARSNGALELAGVVAHKKDVLIGEWVQGVPSALADCVAFVARAMRELNPNDPEALHAVCGAIKILSEAQMNQEVLNVWLEGSQAKENTQ